MDSISKFLSVGFLYSAAIGLIQCAPKPINADVAFISKSPVVDGLLDSDLEHLVEKEFNHILKLDNPDMDPVRVTYRLGYTPTHLYLYIETDAAEVSYHRRGYLWGDGYKLLLGLPQDEPLTNEYYVMAFSPTKDEANTWEKQQIHNYNFTQIHKQFTDQSQSQEASWGTGTGFEAMIAWSDIEPYHPWLNEQLGFNLYFAKGFQTQEEGYFPYGYVVVEDEAIWDEEIERRAYKAISFANPDTVKKQYLRVQPKIKHLAVGDKLNLQTVAVGPKSSRQKIDVEINNESSQTLFKQEFDVITTNKQSITETVLDVGNLDVGIYTLMISSEGYETTTEISVLPTIDFQKLEASLQLNQSDIPKGSAHTFSFKLQQIEQALTDLKSYEEGAHILKQWNEFQKEYAMFESGNDPYAGKLGPYRRGFKSDIDGTYQPYTIKLPDNYDPNIKYPLLVFMHGSGQDEQGLLNRPRSNRNFIELAPYGRDKFRAYASELSQKDIVEAINAVTSSFSVNEDAIVIGGFSMGGYGALRAFYENPDLYQGIAIFAGHPNLASEWLGEDHPNFLDETYLEPFKDMPIFIYHGKKDAALDVNLIVQMSDKLKQVGAHVTMSLVEENGHEYQDETTHKQYSEWLDQVIKED